MWKQKKETKTWEKHSSKNKRKIVQLIVSHYKTKISIKKKRTPRLVDKTEWKEINLKKGTG